jgi:two-component system cell cycle response regulator DivK
MGKVLVVEDEPDNRELIRMVLEMAGHEVVEATTGEAGLEAIREDRPDVVLMDISLPGRYDGLEVTRLIRSDPHIEDLPIVAFTAHAMNGDRERVLNAGCDEYMTKPIEDLMDFSRRITELATAGRKIHADKQDGRG